MSIAAVFLLTKPDSVGLGLERNAEVLVEALVAFYEYRTQYCKCLHSLLYVACLS